MTDPVDQALAFVEAVPLPAPLLAGGLEVAEGPSLPRPDFAWPGELSVAVGSQIAGFGDNVSPVLREQIADAFLLAQLAADKQLENRGGTSEQWYDTYVATLGKVGWAVETSDRTLRTVSGGTAEVHREILSVLTVFLAPTATATSSVVAALNGLAAMDKDAPWITLIQRRSQRANANQFQISQTTIEDGAPVIRLAAFELDANRSITQVLFFCFGQSTATLCQFNQILSVNERVFAAVGPRLAAKLLEHTSEAILAIEI